MIEVYLNTEDLTTKQSLVILDEQGKRWDVQDALASSSSRSGKFRSRDTELVLERWTIQLGDVSNDLPSDLNVILPLVYKKSIVLFRSLYTYTAFLPAWKLSRALVKSRSHHPLKLEYRILDGAQSFTSSRPDTLAIPLCDSRDEVLSDYTFGVTDSPAGPFSVQIKYRLNCEFRVDDSESILSSRFMGADEELFRPSIPGAKVSTSKAAETPEAGSLPSGRRDIVPRPDLGQAYGSLSTFHQVGVTTGTSPITALRNAQDLGTASPTPSPPNRVIPTRRSSQSSRSSTRGAEAGAVTGRRSSISFQPFKTPSLSASPSLAAGISSSPRPSVGRAPLLGTLQEHRDMPPPAVPGSSVKKSTPNPLEASTSSKSSSPRPAQTTRYSSSFSHRRARLSSGGTAKIDEDQVSSGKTSAASSANQPGSGGIPDSVSVGHTTSVHEDDENISDFIKMLELKRDLLTPSDNSAAEASSRRTAAALNKYHRMRDSNAALSESMSMSLHRSSSSSSRQLSSVPPMVAATSASSSSSPGKPISPHTPHTPAIPSRLSANSIIDYSHRGTESSAPSIDDHTQISEEAPSDRTVIETQVSHVPPIDIPTSPRPVIPSYRRSSSAAQRRVATGDDDFGEFYGQRSASMGADIRHTSTTQTGPAETQPDDVASEDRDTSSTGHDDSLRPSSDRYQQKAVQGPQSKLADPTDLGSVSAGSSTHLAQRSRLQRRSGAIGRGQTPHGSESGGSGSFERRGGSRNSFSRPSDARNAPDEDEPFLPFAMSDIGASRRSLEEARAMQGPSNSERDRGSDSRRGSRRATAYHTWNH